MYLSITYLFLELPGFFFYFVINIIPYAFFSDLLFIQFYSCSYEFYADSPFMTILWIIHSPVQFGYSFIHLLFMIKWY